MDGIRKSASNRLREVFLLGASLLLGFVFVYSANVHLSNPYSFLSNVYSYDVVSESFGIVVAAFLPSMQLAVGIALLFFSTASAVLLSCCHGLFVCVYRLPVASAPSRTEYCVRMFLERQG
jgi:hypothetical protein